MRHKKCILIILCTNMHSAQAYMKFLSKFDSETLLPIIEKILRPGCVIKTNKWLVYNGVLNFECIYKI